MKSIVSKFFKKIKEVIISIITLGGRVRIPSSVRNAFGRFFCILGRHKYREDGKICIRCLRTEHEYREPVQSIKDMRRGRKREIGKAKKDEGKKRRQKAFRRIRTTILFWEREKFRKKSKERKKKKEEKKAKKKEEEAPPAEEKKDEGAPPEEKKEDEASEEKKEGLPA